ncbi:MAG TPA: sigma-70 family RNA polymerase sigma factor [Gemmataceae bacterium]|nr:sigma-70 family RNA polymerase sigma factor [Gemmataceae bacterium]
MPTDSTRPLHRHLLAAALRADDRSDRELLGRFVASRDEESFAELVRRHGRMVLAVCRRVTGCPEDAEDAFQAAFLVLARRAGQVGRPELLSNWLYGVAYRTALEARAARRRTKEHLPVSAVPEPPAREPEGFSSPEDADLRRVIDEELAGLPEKYRSCVVLCDLEGVSRKDAAARLCIPEGTLSSRLNHARKALAARLTRRGVSASAGGLGAFFTRDAIGAAVPFDLAQQTARAAARFAAGGTLSPEFVSPHVTTLTDGVIKAMTLNRRLMLGLGVLAIGLLGLGAAAGLGQFPNRARNYQGAGQEFAVGQQPPSADKAKLAEKVPAKGVEDEDVPYPSFPMQAVVRVEGDGKLMIRLRSRQTVMTKKEVDGQVMMVRENQTVVHGRAVDASDVSVFDMKGNRVPEKTWKDKLKTDKLVLVSFDGRLPMPRELQLVKDDTLLIVFPPGTAGPDGAWVPTTTYQPVQGPNGQYYYHPMTEYRPAPAEAYPPPAPAPAPPSLIPSNGVPPATAPTAPGSIPPPSLPNNPGT